MLEVAARSIGGLCSRTLRLGAGISLEEVILRHALALPLPDLRRESAGVGRDDAAHRPVRHPGRGVHGQDAARAVPGVVGLEITIPRGPTDPGPARGRPVPGFPVRPGQHPGRGRGGVAPRARSSSTSTSCDRTGSGRGRSPKCPVPSTDARAARLLLRARPPAPRRRRARGPAAVPPATRSAATTWPSRPGIPGSWRGPTGWRAACRCTPRPASPARSSTTCADAAPSCRWPATASTARRCTTSRTGCWPVRATPSWSPGSRDTTTAGSCTGSGSARWTGRRPVRCCPRSTGTPDLVHADRRAAGRRGRGQPRLCAPVPALPGAGGVRRPHPGGRGRRGARRRRPAGRGRRRARHVRRPRLLERRRSTHVRGRARPARAAPRADLRLHRQGRARPGPPRSCGRSSPPRAACSWSPPSRASTTRPSSASTRGTPPATRGRRSSLLREQGIEVRPSWLPFTPWTTLDQVRALLDFVADHDLVGNVDPVQYTIRLLLPPGSLLLEPPGRRSRTSGPTTPSGPATAWRGADPGDGRRSSCELAALVEERLEAGDSDPRRVRAGPRRGRARAGPGRRERAPQRYHGSPSRGSAAPSRPRRSSPRSLPDRRSAGPEIDLADLPTRGLGAHQGQLGAAPRVGERADRDARVGAAAAWKVHPAPRRGG